MPSAAEHWRDSLATWAIPDAILAAAPESPWTYPTAFFARRADTAVTRWTPSTAAADAALPTGGVVLDVGCGAGTASLPLAPRAGTLIGVDPEAELLAAFATRAQATGRTVRTFQGRWPDCAVQVPVADVVVCHNVAYNVADLAAFAQALTAHARQRVVLELTACHPLSTLNDLWLHFHGLVRPSEPTASDAASVLRELGLVVERTDWDAAMTDAEADLSGDLVARTRRQLCLPATRDPEIAAMLAARLDDPSGAPRPRMRAVVTLWWPGTGA